MRSLLNALTVKRYWLRRGEILDRRHQGIDAYNGKATVRRLDHGTFSVIDHGRSP
jgi:hypothetical protein